LNTKRLAVRQARGPPLTHLYEECVCKISALASKLREEIEVTDSRAIRYLLDHLLAYNCMFKRFCMALQVFQGIFEIQLGGWDMRGFLR